MKLYEEMNMWESLWEDRIETYIDEKTEKIIDELLEQADIYVIEYEGFDEDYAEDHWDYSSESHYQTSSTAHYGDFEYEIEVGDVWEDIVNISQQDIEKHKFIQSAGDTNLINTLIKLQKETEEAPKDQATLYWNRLGVFVAENLDDLFDIFYEYFYDKYEELAYEWALDSLDPDWD
jgi:hypothetical protein